MRWLYSPFLVLSLTIPSIASPLPYEPIQNPSISQSPSPSILLPSTPLNLTEGNRGGWPTTPWTYRDGPQIVKFEEYGRLANSTLTKDIIRATLNIQAYISKGRPIIKNGPITIRHGAVIFKIMISGRETITREEAFRILDQWRVYVGAFGAKEILLGEIGNAEPWAPAAAFNIVFNADPVQNIRTYRSDCNAVS